MYYNPVFIKKINANFDGRDFVIGDLHGCYDELISLLDYVKFNSEHDRLFCTGDLIDRGPHSRKCLELLDKSWFFSVLGNHEDLFLNKLTTLTIKENSDNIEYVNALISYKEKILTMPLIYEINHLLTGNYYVMHSEILPEHIQKFNETNLKEKEYNALLNAMKKFDFSNQIVNFFNYYSNKSVPYDLKQKILWSRKIVTQFYKEHREAIDEGDFSFLEDQPFLQKTKIFCGHNVVPFPMKIGQQYYLDTGAALGYSEKEISTPLFTQFGHQFFTLSMVEVTTGTCYGCVTSKEERGKILKLEKTLY